MKSKTKVKGAGKTKIRAKKGGYHRSVYGQDSKGQLYRYATKAALQADGMQYVPALKVLELKGKGKDVIDKRVYSKEVPAALAGIGQDLGVSSSDVAAIVVATIQALRSAPRFISIPAAGERSRAAAH